MLRTLIEHKQYLNSDLARFKNGKPTIIDMLLNNEKWYIWRFLYHLRCVEYHYGKGGMHKLKYIYHWYLYKRLCWKLKWTIRPFVLGPGTHAYHVGDFVHIGDDCKIGKNFTFQCGVVLAQGCNITIGDNVTLNLGVKVIKPIHIGNNVVVGANAVVTHDLPDGAVAVGIPAKVIKMKSTN